MNSLLIVIQTLILIGNIAKLDKVIICDLNVRTINIFVFYLWRNVYSTIFKKINF